MHLLDRIRKVASYLLAATLILQAAFTYAMTALAMGRSVKGVEGYGVDTTIIFAGLTVLFVEIAQFFVWFGSRAGR